ncbi:MAG: AI-2E family transporter [Eubacteriales bacterium]|nr:AI-2E family transporter [Eubacteriales bacterium]
MKWKDKIDKKYMKLSLYVVATILVGYLAIQLVNHFSQVMGSIREILTWFNRILVPLACGFAIAYVLLPFIEFLEKQLKKLKFIRKKPGRGRTLSVLITFFLILAILFIGFSMLISSVNRQIQTVSVESLENLVNAVAQSMDDLYKMIQNTLDQWDISSTGISKTFTEMSNNLGNILKNTGTNLVGTLSHLQGFFTTLLFSVIFSIYFLLDGQNLMKYWGRVFYALFGARAKKEGKRLLDDAVMVFSGYLRGQLMDALFMAVVVSIALSILGVKFALLIGLATGVGNLIPYVGPIVAYISTALVCLMDGDFKRLIVAIIVLFVVQTIDGNVVNPKLLSSNVDIHPVLVIISLIIGGAAAGFLGMLIGVPVGAFLKIQFERFVNWLVNKRDCVSEQK